MSYTTLAEKIRWVETNRLERLGNSYVMRCHFHEEITPSMVVMPIQGAYLCYGCGKTGNLDEIVYEHIR